MPQTRIKAAPNTLPRHPEVTSFRPRFIRRNSFLESVVANTHTSEKVAITEYSQKAKCVKLPLKNSFPIKWMSSWMGPVFHLKMSFIPKQIMLWNCANFDQRGIKEYWQWWGVLLWQFWNNFSAAALGDDLNCNLSSERLQTPTLKQTCSLLKADQFLPKNSRGFVVFFLICSC